MNKPHRARSVEAAKERLLVWGEATQVLAHRRVGLVKERAAIGSAVLVGSVLILRALPRARATSAAITPRRPRLVWVVAALVGRSILQAAVAGAVDVAKSKTQTRRMP